MKVLHFFLLLSAVYSSSGRNLAELKTLERSPRSFKRGAITILNDLNEFVRVSVQAGIQSQNCLFEFWETLSGNGFSLMSTSSLELDLVTVRSLDFSRLQIRPALKIEHTGLENLLTLFCSVFLRTMYYHDDLYSIKARLYCYKPQCKSTHAKFNAMVSQRFNLNKTKREPKGILPVQPNGRWSSALFNFRHE